MYHENKRNDFIRFKHPWIDIYTTDNPDLEINLARSDEHLEDGFDMSLINNFDYETLPGNRREFYSDLTMRMPNVASITIRSQFQIVAEDFDWDLFFAEDILYPLIEAALNSTTNSFKSICQNNHLQLPTLMLEEGYTVGEEMVKQLCKGIVDQYFNNRRQYNIENKEAIETIALECPMGTTMNISLNVTFMLLDEILFNNKHFKKKQNRAIFFTYVPEMKYNTLRMKCIQIGKHDVKLTQMDVYFFLKCIDCAVQMLVGDKSDYLIAGVDPQNITPKIQHVLFKSASELFAIYNNNPKDKNSLNEEKLEWNKLIQ